MKKSTYNPEYQFIEAEGFLRQTQAGIKGKQDSTHLGMMAINSIVNYAFACEIFLKCIHNILGYKQEGEHSLLKLFNLLPDKDNFGNNPKDLIKSFYKNNVKITLAAIARNLPETLPSPTNLIDFDSTLTLCDKNFERWRYAYEYTPEDLKTKGLKELCYAIRDYIIILNPSWVQYINKTSSNALNFL